ncbi:zinc carboxypeptidase family protein (macronuclear) [Tetrahymena thermophila SB210]|uniref:Zinc carboxypeptidase family protein n=1 Tax=Tetrahymena thermophila (strain SB210) TaxID=312017 RepID=W7X594_TETTS|nr:zinc carboxypeptidase family protein [Tetrahymena thermophila SB210]EWS71528.1 zinc carboxypeptidase family protein [Tetrahymena thermophila SB210]|eukprot:XP_012655939.1 zinc carboxypeptidase family protein [Tetrahymena thermophila SB210]
MSLENQNGDQKFLEQNIQTEKKILQIIDELEDVYIHQSLWLQGKEFLYSIQDKDIRQDSRILNIEARLLIQEDPVESERLMQSIFLKDPLYFKNTFEYLTFLVDSSQAKSNLVLKKLQNLLFNFQDERLNDAYYLACKSLTLKSKKNMNISRQILKEAIQKAKKPYQKADMYAQLGNTFLDLEDFENAILCYTQGLQIQPQNDECLNNISYCYLEMNELQKAIQFGELALQNYPNNSTVLGNLAYVYEELNQLDKAENAYLTLLQNKSINSVQYSNYSQFLFYFRFKDPQNRIQILENLTKGFLLDPNRQNPIFSTFYELLKKTDQFAKVIYSYQPIMYYINFIETVRLIAPHLLLRMIVKIFLNLQFICSSEADEEYQDFSDQSQDSQEELENQNENQSAQIQNPIIGSERQQEEIKSEQQSQCLTSICLQNITQNQNEEKDDELETIQSLQPYSDSTFKQEISTLQKVQIYKLMHDLIKVKIKENQIVNSLIVYNKFISQNLHFKNNIQFWDLYFD